jgi:hypothetical protein
MQDKSKGKKSLVENITQRLRPHNDGKMMDKAKDLTLSRGTWSLMVHIPQLLLIMHLIVFVI